MTTKISADSENTVQAKVPERNKVKVDAETAQDILAKVPERTTVKIGG